MTRPHSETMERVQTAIMRRLAVNYRKLAQAARNPIARAHNLLLARHLEHLLERGVAGCPDRMSRGKAISPRHFVWLTDPIPQIRRKRACSGVCRPWHAACASSTGTHGSRCFDAYIAGG